MKSQRHRFNKIFVSNLPEADGHFILAEEQNDEGIYTVFVSVRGSNNNHDWITNAQILPQFAGNSYVHSGWFSRTAQIPLGYLYERLLGGAHVVVTGHSLGGAVAQLITNELLRKIVLRSDASELKSRVRCISFAPPLVFTSAGAEMINRLFKDNFVHFIHPLDCVPKLLSWCNGALSTIFKDKNLNQNESLKKMMTNIIDGFLPDVSDVSVWNILLKNVALPTFTKIVAQSACDLFSYKPVGQYWLIGYKGECVSALADESLSSALSYESFRVTSDLRVHHSMKGTYAAFIGGIFETFTSDPRYSQYVAALPATLELPLPKIDAIILHKVPEKNEFNIQLKGSHLYAIRKVDMIDLRVCQIQNHFVNYDKELISESCLRFSKPGIFSVLTDPINDDETSKLSNSVMTSAFVRAFFNPEQLITLNDVIIMNESDPLDYCSFQELLIATLFMLLFSGHFGENLENLAKNNGIASSIGRQKLSRIYRLFDEILTVLPAHLLVSNPFTLQLVLNDEWKCRELWRTCERGRSEMKSYRDKFLDIEAKALKEGQDFNDPMFAYGGFLSSGAWRNLKNVLTKVQVVDENGQVKNDD